MGQVITEAVVEQIRDDKLDQYWGFIEAEMDRIPHVWADWWTKDAIYYGLANNLMQLWAAGPKDAIHIILITQIAEYPANRVLQCILAFGQRVEENFEALAATLENYGRSHGCSQFDVWGRRGWAKKLAKFPGMEQKVILSFPISKERLN